ARLAMKSGVLKGILWHQGESDCTPELALSYEAKLHDLITRLRRELDTASVPFITGQMGQFAENPWNDSAKMVDHAHQALPEKVNRTAFVSSAGLQHKGDKIHFDSPSYREFGRRYAEAFLKLESSKRGER